MDEDPPNVRGRPKERCCCSSLTDLEVVPMGGDGLDERIFSTMERVRDHGSDLWWLSLDRCSACGQDWMVAADERIYDNFYLRRLGPLAVQQTASGTWPDDFSSFERVLTLGANLGKPVRFLDSFAYSLQWTVEDLRKERSDISPREIARLLGLSPGHARLLFWKVRLLGVGRLHA